MTKPSKDPFGPMTIAETFDYYLTDPAIEPLHDRVLVKRIDFAGWKSLIYIPDCAKSTTRLAKVLAVGPGAWRDGVFTKTAVKPGDVVVLPGIAAVMPDWESHDQILVQEGDIGAILAEI